MIQTEDLDLHVQWQSCLIRVIQKCNFRLLFK